MLVSEGLGKAFQILKTGSPLKAIKIAKALKAYTKYKLDLASIKMDAIKRKEASGNQKLEPIEKEKLEQAEKSKIEAVKGKLDAVNSQISNLATSDALKNFAKVAKSTADMESAKKLLNIAQGEEAAALKLKIDKYKEDITTGEDRLEDYEKSDDDKTSNSNNNTNTETTDTETANIEDKENKQNKENSEKNKNKKALDDFANKLEDSRSKLKEEKSKDNPDQSVITKLEADIEKYNKLVIDYAKKSGKISENSIDESFSKIEHTRQLLINAGLI